MTESADQVPGPLGAMIDSLPSTHDELPYAPVHVRVLDVEAEDGLSAVLAAWESVADTPALFQQIRERIEGALLAELSLPAAQLGADYRPGWDWCRLISFGAISQEAADTLAWLGLSPVTGSGDAWRRALTHLRAESQLVGLEIDGRAHHAYEAQISRPLDQEANICEWETNLQRALVGHPWGVKPGFAWSALASLMGRESPAQLTDLDELESRLMSRETGVIRWVSPMIFQAACDLVGVLSAGHFGREVQWAACEPDTRGMAPPPLLRVNQEGGPIHIPIGLHLLRWWVMPLRPGEEPAPLTAWLEDQFA